MKELIESLRSYLPLGDLTYSAPSSRVYAEAAEALEAQMQEIEGWKGGYANLLHEHQVIAEGLRQERDVLVEHVRVLRDVLVIAEIGSCHCQVKSPDIKYHAITCPYRIIREILEVTGEK